MKFKIPKIPKEFRYKTLYLQEVVVDDVYDNNDIVYARVSFRKKTIIINAFRYCNGKKWEVNTAIPANKTIKTKKKFKTYLNGLIEGMNDDTIDFNHYIIPEAEFYKAYFQYQFDMFNGIVNDLGKENDIYTITKKEQIELEVDSIFPVYANYI